MSGASWLARADAAGHCLLIFAFVPLLATLAEWIGFEATNPLNAHDPVVLAFVLARGVDRLLDAFHARAVVGVTAGLAYGLFACLLMRRESLPPPRARLVLGAIGGIIAAAIGLAVALAVRALLPDAPGDAQPRGAAFEIAAGLVCGVVAIPGALHFLARPPVAGAEG